ncbi:insulinase-like protein peptidase, peptidase M16 family Pqql_like protein [Psychroflexus torquis ATCC 700755]|uniref:Insulinase-like protein peptidase, peptidase M16 family Pqql_like protein n=1 Tax=Psychroflexus torquis (strain ATCC 700755 / CIP 106069 / ACAM 623) TaxID=313595 RepID=K4IGT3_PSYTT|nr:pitrilysin family protein [Psychroflexus torquis]AFU68286.1 insulinase-like protein peptidase, peptidase M16 family Pqql_like protein [Psychroflexus torquis ATCC 700755]
MKKIFALLIICLVSTSITAQIDRSQMPKSGPAPTVNIGEPETFSLSNGLKVLVVENDKLPRVSASLIIDNTPFTEMKPGTQAMVASLLGTGTEKTSKEEFNEEIDFLGANISFGSESATASSLSKFFPRVMELMAEGALIPNFTEEEFESEKNKLMEGLKSGQKDVGTIANRLSTSLSYGSDHPYGQYVSVESVEGIVLKDVKNVYRNYFVPENAYLVIVGDITKKDAKKIVKKTFGDWKKAKPPSTSIPPVKPAQYTQIDFVDMPNAVQSEIIAQNTVDLKKSDPDYFPVLVMNQILGGSFGSYLNMNLREDKGYTYGARSSVGASRYASRFVASVGVRNAVTDSAVVEIFKEVDRIRNEEVDAGKLEDTKKKFAGSFVMRLEQPSTVASYALDIETDNLSKDFYETYLEKINAVTQEDIKRVANKYLKTDQMQVVIAGKGSEVVENLEKIEYKGKIIPVLYFNKETERVEKPEFKKELPEGVTVSSVYDSYIKAIGGNDVVSKFNDMMMKGNASVQGMSISFTRKLTKDGKMLELVQMNGNTLSKQVFDGKKGFTAAQGQKTDYTEQQVKDAKIMSGLFSEQKVSESAELTGIESLNGEDAYVIRLTENVREFYSVDSGLKLATETTAEQMGQKMTSKLMYSDYTDKNGVMVPMMLSQDLGPQTIDIKIEEVKFNDGVTASDFE